MEGQIEKALGKNREELDDESFENLLTLLSHYIFSEIEEIVPFDEKSEKEREEIAKLVTKTMETSTVILFELIPNGSVDKEKLKSVVNLLGQEKFKDAHKVLCEEE